MFCRTRAEFLMEQKLQLFLFTSPPQPSTASTRWSHVHAHQILTCGKSSSSSPDDALAGGQCRREEKVGNIFTLKILKILSIHSRRIVYHDDMPPHHSSSSVKCFPIETVSQTMRQNWAKLNVQLERVRIARSVRVAQKFHSTHWGLDAVQRFHSHLRQKTNFFPLPFTFGPISPKLSLLLYGEV